MGKMFIDDRYFEHREFAELIIADFICYHISNGYDLDLKKEKKMISSFIDNYFFGVD